MIGIYFSLIPSTKIDVVKINLYTENVVASYTAQKFQSHFRLTREAFEFVLNQIRVDIPAPGPGKPLIDLEKQFLAVIWLLSTPDSYRYVAQRIISVSC